MISKNTPYNGLRNIILDGRINLEKSEIRCALLNENYHFNPEHQSFSELSKFEVCGKNYIQGGVILPALRVQKKTHETKILFDLSAVCSGILSFENVTLVGRNAVRNAVFYINNESQSLLFCVNHDENVSIKNSTYNLCFPQGIYFELVENDNDEPETLFKELFFKSLFYNR